MGGRKHGSHPVHPFASSNVAIRTPNKAIGCFGRLTPLGVEFKMRRVWHCVCRCECGQHTAVPISSLLKGCTKSCGCLLAEHHASGEPRNIRHGARHTRLYRIWSGLKSRCMNPANKDYADYGGRGISVDAAWVKDFAAFMEWATASGYDDCLSIDRIDGDGNYEPGNCRWATQRQQCSNKKCNLNITAFGETKVMAEWARNARCEVSRSAFYTRVRDGVPPELAMKPGYLRHPNRKEHRKP